MDQTRERYDQSPERERRALRTRRSRSGLCWKVLRTSKDLGNTLLFQEHSIRPALPMDVARARTRQEPRMELIEQIFHALFPPTSEKIALLTNPLGLWLYALMFVVIFCETGLVVTPILPGDSLLFAIGAVAADAQSTISLPWLIGLLTAAAVLGDAVNYAIGKRLGPKVFKYEQSRFFNKQHLLKAHAFYEKYGGITIILARFMPIVRTFAPFVAGIGLMSYARFFVYNVVGAVAWVLICVLSGVWFGQSEIVKKHFELVLIAIVLISVLPMVVERLLAWRRARRGAAEKVTLPVEPPQQRTAV